MTDQEYAAEKDRQAKASAALAASARKGTRQSSGGTWRTNGYHVVGPAVEPYTPPTPVEGGAQDTGQPARSYGPGDQ